MAAAAQWTTAVGLGPGDEPDYPRDPAYLVLARVLLAQSDPRPALTLLQRLLDPAASQGRTGSVIEIQAVRALVLAACDDDVGAVGALTEAVTLVRRHGYVRVFADEGAPMRALLAQLPAARPGQQPTDRGIVPGYLAALVRACGPAITRHQDGERSERIMSPAGVSPAHPATGRVRPAAWFAGGTRRPYDRARRTLAPGNQTGVWQVFERVHGDPSPNGHWVSLLPGPWRTTPFMKTRLGGLALAQNQNRPAAFARVLSASRMWSRGYRVSDEEVR